MCLEQNSVPSTVKAAQFLSETEAGVRHEAENLLSAPWLIATIQQDISSIGVTGESDLALTLYLVGVSRLLERPLAAIVQGPSSSGKSFVIERVRSLFPDECVYDATQLTPNALVYEAEPLSNKFVVAGERSHGGGREQADATRLLREMLSAGQINKRVAVCNDGSIETKEYKQRGPIAFVESTTLTEVFDEDANRCLLLQTDERSEQTRAIMKQSAAKYSTSPSGVEVAEIQERHHTLQRCLEAKAVAIPYADHLAEVISAERNEVRRTFQHLLSLIEAITLLHQRQRETDERGRLISTADDYKVARELMEPAAARVIGKRLSAAAERFHVRLQSWAPLDKFTTREAIQRESACERSVRGWLAELHNVGMLDLVEPSRGRMPAKWEIGAYYETMMPNVLPWPEEIFLDFEIDESERRAA